MKSAASPFPLASNSKAPTRLLPAADKRIINSEETPLLEDNLSKNFKGLGYGFERTKGKWERAEEPTLPTMKLSGECAWESQDKNLKFIEWSSETRKMILQSPSKMLMIFRILYWLGYNNRNVKCIVQDFTCSLSFSC